MSCLLVLIPDRISDVLKKGEYQPGYYNPGNVFDEVHIMSTSVDEPDLDLLQYTVGNAKLHVHFHSDDLTLPPRHSRWLTPARLRRWARGGVELARQIKPDLIRCHGSDWNAYLASRIKKATGVPYVVSLHINPDINPTRRVLMPRDDTQRRINGFYEYVESEGLRNADLVMPVYRPILPYLKRLGVSQVEVCYNILNGQSLKKKDNYALHGAGKVIYVGRLVAGDKDPSNILKALTRLPGVEYMIVGDGPAREDLEKLAAELGLADRVIFRPSVRNADLCEMLPDYDIFAVHTEYWEISKSVLEALLAGLPCIINRRLGEPVPEFSEEFVCLVENSDEGYEEALRGLLERDADREALGRNAFAHARANWGPDVTEAKVRDIYRSFLPGDKNA